MQANFKVDREIIDSLHLNDYFEYEIKKNKDKYGPAKQQVPNFASTQLAVLLLQKYGDQQEGGFEASWFDYGQIVFTTNMNMEGPEEQE